MNEDKDNINVSIDGGGAYIAIALLFIFFLGDPDLCDATIHWLMK